MMIKNKIKVASPLLKIVTLSFFTVYAFSPCLASAKPLDILKLSTTNIEIWQNKRRACSYKEGYS